MGGRHQAMETSAERAEKSTPSLPKKGLGAGPFGTDPGARMVGARHGPMTQGEIILVALITALILLGTGLRRGV